MELIPQAASKRNIGIWWVLAAAVLWGTTGTTQALAPQGAQPASIGSLRIIIGGLALLIYALWRGAFSKGDRWPVGSTLVAAISMAAYQLFFFTGVARTGVAVGTIVGIGSSPILAGVFGYLLRGEKPGRRWLTATLMAITGCALLAVTGGSIHVDIGGMLLAIGAGGAYALFTVTSKGLLVHKPPEAVMAVTFCLGAVFLLPFGFANSLTWLSQPGGIAVALHLGLVTVAVAYSLFARGLRLVPVATAATLTLAEPLTAAFLGIFVLGERLTLGAAAGILLILAGLVLLSVNIKTDPAMMSSPG